MTNSDGSYRSDDAPLSGTPRPTSLGYHVIAGEDLLTSLRRCAAGEDADTVYAELWANAEHEHVEPDAEDRPEATQ